MRIEKVSMISGLLHVRDIDITQEQLDYWKESDKFIQDIAPHLSEDEREFLMTGSTPEEWDTLFGDED